MIKTALFFGSFNPIHNGHMMLAQHTINFGGVDEVWFVVSPHNPFKEDKELLPAEERVKMARAGVGKSWKMSVCDIELHLPVPSYTVVTLAELQRLHPDREFALLIGGDNLAGLPNWREAETICRGRRIIVYPRPGQVLDAAPVEALGGKVEILDAPLLDISSTMIRKWADQCKTVRHFVPEETWKIIYYNGYYQY